MRLKEQRLWDTLKRQTDGSSLWLQRIENLCVAGMPDVLAVNGRGDLKWVELKACDVPKRGSTALLGDRSGLNPAQRGWHLKAASMNVQTWVLVRAGKEHFLVPGRFAAEINDWPLSLFKLEPSVAEGWEQIVKVLVE
jgi:hypothetical protein